jgi:hypothetical protein
MVMPTVHVKVVADTSAAEAGLEIVESKLVGVGATASKVGGDLGGFRAHLKGLAGTATSSGAQVSQAFRSMGGSITTDFSAALAVAEGKMAGVGTASAITSSNLNVLSAKMTGLTGSATLASAGLNQIESKLAGVSAGGKIADAALGTTRSSLVQLTGSATLASAGLNQIESKFTGVNRSAGLAAAAMRGANPHMVQLGTATRVTGGHTANLTAQFNDIGVMMASGQSPLILAMQQGTQISQVFQSMGGDAKSAFAGIKAGLLSMVSPMAILTIGTIAGAAALFQWATRADEADEAAEALTERLDKAREASVSLRESLRGLRLGIDVNELALLDEVATAQKELNDLIERRETTSRRSGSTGAQAISEAQAILDIAQEELEVYQAQILEKDRLNNLGRDHLSIQQRQLEYAAQTRIESDEQTKSAQDLLIEMAAQNEMQRTINRYGEDSVEVAELRAKAERDVFEEMLSTLGVSEDLKDQLRLALDQGIAIAGLDMSGGITEAATEAGRLADNLARARGERLDALVGGNVDFFDPRNESGSSGVVPEDRRVPAENRSGYVAPSTRATGRTPSGGGGRQTPEEIRAADLELLIESLKTESEVIAEWHQTSMENLDSANDQELTILGGHQEAKERLEAEHQRRLAGMRAGYQGDGLTQAATFFGQMEGAMQGSSEKMLRISKVFGAARSLINSYQAYTEVLKTPDMPLWMRIPAAVGVLSAGLGMVSAIKGVSAGGGGVSTGAAAQSSTPTPAAETGGAPSINRSVTLIGDRGFSREQIEQIIELANEGQENGIRIRGRR